MIDTLLYWYKQYEQFTAGNQFLAAALAASVIAVVSYIFKSLPLKIFNFLSERFIVKLVLLNDDGYKNKDIYEEVSSWLQVRSLAYFCKSVMIAAFSKGEEENSDTNSGYYYRLRPGEGTNILFYKRKLFWYSVHLDTSSQSNVYKETLTLKCLSFTTDVFEDIVKDVFTSKRAEGLFVYTLNKQYWNKNIIPFRTDKSVILPNNLKENITKQIDTFIADKAWYENSSIHYKLTILLTGSPGCGKTSLIRFLGSHYKRPVYSLDLQQVDSDATLVDILAKVQKGSIVCMEDIDCIGKTFRARKDNDDEADSVASLSTMTGVTLSGMLNALDGLLSLNDVIIIMTTNNPDKIDPAIKRKGRTDYIHELTPFGKQEIYAYTKNIYESNLTIDLPDDVSIKGCDLQALVLENKHDLKGYLKDLKALVHESK